jgi:hypothetical protein
MFLVVKPFYFAYFERAIVFVQSRVDLNVMSLMLSYHFRVLYAVARFVFVLFHYVIIAIFSDVTGHARLSDAVRGCLLIVVILILILSDSAGRANHCQS